MTTSYREWSSAVDDEFLAHSIDVGADLTQFDVGQMFPEHGWNLGRGPTASPVTSDDDGTDDGLDAGCNQNDCMYCEQLADEHECSSALHRRCQHNLISSTNILSCGDDSMMSSAVITEQADLEFTDQMRVLETIVEETAEDMLSDSSSTGMSDHVPSSWFGSLTSVCDDLCCQQQMAAGHTSDGAICSQVSLDSSSADVTFSIIDGECSAASSGLPSLDATFNTSATMFPFGVISADQHIDVAISEDRTVPTRLTEVTPPNVQVASPVTIWSADDSASNGHLNEWQTFSSDDEVVPSDFLSETTASLNTVPFDGAPTEVRYTDDAPVENNVELVVASDDDFDSLDRRIETLTFDFEEEERRTIEHSTSGLGGRCGSVDSSEGMKRYRSFCDLSMIDEPGTLESEARKDSGGRVSPTLSKSSENSCDETKTRRMSVRCHAKLSSENLSEDSGYSDHGPQTHQSDDDVSPEYVRLSNGEVVHTPRIISGFMDIILRSIRLGVKSGVGSSDNASRVVNRTANLDSEPHVNRVLSISTPNLSPTAYQHRRRRRLIELIWRDALRRHQSCMGQTSASVRTLEAQSASQTLPTAMQNHSLPHAKCDNEIAGKHNFIVGHDTLPDINVCLANILRSADAVIPKYDLFKYPLFSRHRVNKSCFVNDIPSEYSSIYSSLEYRDRNPWASWVQCRMAGCEVSDLPFSKRNQLVRSSPNVHFSGRQTEAESRFSLSSAICSFAAPKETEENRHAHFKCASDDGREQPRVVSAAEECRLLTMHRSQTGRPKPLDLQLAEEFILLENNNDCSECAAHYTPMCDSRDACFGHGESAASIVAHESFSPNGTVVGSAAAAATASACPSYDTAASVFASGEEDGQLCSVNAVHSRCAELCAESCVCVPTIATRCQLAGVGMCERRSQVLFDETPTTAGNDTPAVNVTGDDERHCDRDGGSGNLTTNRIVLDAANLTDVTTSQACNSGELLSPYGHASRHMNVLSSFRPASNESVRSDPTLTICRTDCNSSFGSAAPLFHAQCGDGAPQCDTVRSAGELDRDNRFAHPAVYVCSVSAMRRPPLLPCKIIATKNVTDNQAEKRRIGESVCISSASDVCGFADTPPNTVAVEHLPARVSSPNLKSMEANRCVTPVITSDRTMPASLSSSTSVQRDGSGSLQLISRPFEDSAKRVVNERTKSYKPSLATKPASLKLIKRRAFLRNVPPPTIKPLESCISSDKVTQASSDLPRHLSQNVKVYCNDVHVEERANNREFAGGVLPSAKCVNDSSDSASINEFSSYTNGVNAVLRDHDCPSSHNTTNNLVVNSSTNFARDDSSGDVTVLKSVDRRLKADSQLLAALARVPRLSRSSHNLTQLVAPLTVSDTRGHFCDGLMSLPPPPQIPDPPMPTSMTCTRHVSAADRVEQSLRRFTDDTKRQRQELARSAPDLSRLIERSAQTLVSGREAALGDAVGHTAAPTPPRSRCHSPTTTRSHTPSAESNTFTTSRPPSIDRRDVTDSADCDDAGGDSRGGGRGVHRSCCCFSSVPLGYVPAGSCVYRNDVCGRNDCADGYCKRAECEDNGEVAGADDATSVETALRVSSSVLPSDSVSSSCAVVSSSGSKQRYARLRAEALARARCREQQQQQLPYRETDLDAVFEERLQLRHPPSHPSTQLAQPSLSSFHGAGSGRARAKSLADLPQVLDHNSDVSDSTTELAVTQRYDTMSTSFSSTSAAAVATSGSRAKSVEYLLNAVDKVATQPPENVLQQQRRGGGGGGATDGSGGGGAHCTSEHELRFQRSLRNLHVPDWYKRSVAAASPAGCAAGLRRDFGSGSLTGGWSGFNSKSNSKESLQSSQCTTPSSSTAAAAISQHPLPSTSSAAGIGSHAFFRNSASTSHLPGRCYSSTASPAVRAGGAGSRFFDWRSSAADGASSGVVAGPQQQHVYLGWRSQERLQAAAAGGGGAASSGGGGGATGSATSSGYQTPAERLACSSIARMRSDSRLDSMGGGGWRRRHWRQPPSVDVHSSIRAVTSAIVDYFDSPDSTVAAGSSTSVSDLACRRGSRRSGTASPATCPMAAGTGSPWVETAFVGVKPTDQPSTPEATPDAAQCVLAASSHALQIAKQPSNSSFPVPTSNMGVVSVQTPRTLANGASPVLASSSNAGATSVVRGQSGGDKVRRGSSVTVDEMLNSLLSLAPPPAPPIPASSAQPFGPPSTTVVTSSSADVMTSRRQSSTAPSPSPSRRGVSPSRAIYETSLVGSRPPPAMLSQTQGRATDGPGQGVGSSWRRPQWPPPSPPDSSCRPNSITTVAWINNNSSSNGESDSCAPAVATGGSTDNCASSGDSLRAHPSSPLTERALCSPTHSPDESGSLSVTVAASRVRFDPASRPTHGDGSVTTARTLDNGAVAGRAGGSFLDDIARRLPLADEDMSETEAGDTDRSAATTTPPVDADLSQHLDEDNSDHQQQPLHHHQQRDQESDAFFTVKCKNSLCVRTTRLTDAKKTFKMCHNCETFYCSRDCRRTHWDRHRRVCSAIRAQSMAKQVILKIRDDELLLAEFSRAARQGFASHGRGLLKVFFPSPESADDFLARQSPSASSALYIKWQDLLPREMGHAVYREIIELCKSYNPEKRLVLYVAVCVFNEMPLSGAARWERQIIPRCAKLSMTSLTSAKVRVTSSTPDSAAVEETLILVSLPNSLPDVPAERAREIVLLNALRHLRARGVSLRRDHPEVYSRLCAYADRNEPVSPVTIHPRDQLTGRTFMCLIMPDASAEHLRRLPRHCGRVKTVNLSVDHVTET